MKLVSTVLTMRSRVPVALIIAGALVIGAVGVVAAATSTNHYVYACVNKTTQAVRYVGKAACNSNESRIRWNQAQRGGVGPRGPQGPAGLMGTQGARGFSGPQGPAGPSGLPGHHGSSGAEGIDGAAGVDGVDGASAFEIAVEAGFEGTESEWLAALHGPRGASGTNGTDGAAGANGADGAAGKSAYQIAVGEGFGGSESDWLASLVGKDGNDGTDGKDGAPGPQGPAGTFTRELVTQTSAMNSSSAKTVTASCPTGMDVVGGGVKINGTDTALAVAASYPTGTGSWTGEAHEIEFLLSNWSITTYVICLTD